MRTGFRCTDEENEAALSSLRRRAWLALRSKIDEQTADTVLLAKLKFAFEDRFRYDTDGVPRVWRPNDDIDTLFREAKEEVRSNGSSLSKSSLKLAQVLAFIALYGRIEPSDPDKAFDVSSLAPPDAEEEDADLSLTVLSETKRTDLASKFRREADAYYVEAKRSMVSSISQIPVWIYAVLALLGWNEFIAVLRSPVYFTMVALIAGVTYVTFRLNMQGPVLAVAAGTYNTAVKVAHDRLADHFSSDSLAMRAVPAPLPEPRRKLAAESIELREKSE